MPTSSSWLPCLAFLATFFFAFLATFFTGFFFATFFLATLRPPNKRECERHAVTRAGADVRQTSRHIKLLMIVPICKIFASTILAEEDGKSPRIASSRDFCMVSPSRCETRTGRHKRFAQRAAPRRVIVARYDAVRISMP